MLWELKIETAFFDYMYPQHKAMFNSVGKKIFIILRSKRCSFYRVTLQN